MRMLQQHCRDLLALVRKERKYQIGLSLLVVLGTIVSFAPGSPPRLRNSRQYDLRSHAGTMQLNNLNHSTHVDLVNAYSQRQEDLIQNVRQLGSSIERVEHERRDFEETTTRIFAEVIRKLNEQSQPVEDASDKSKLPELIDEKAAIVDATVPSNDNAVAAANNLEAWEVPSIEPVGLPTAPKAARVAAAVTGCRVRARLASGVSAPVEGAPYPVTLDLISDVICPNNLHLPLGQASVMAAAQGSLTDARVLFRINKLSLAFPSGRLREIETDGWVVGEDGIRGLRGSLNDPLSSILRGHIQAGTAQGIGDALAGSNMSERLSPLGERSLSVTGEELDYAAGQGVSQAAQQYGKAIEKRSRLLIPHVEVLSGREVTIVFARAFQVPGLLEELDSTAIGDSVID